MEGVLTKIYNYVWDPYFWFPEGMTWENVTSKDPAIYYGRPKDIHWCVVVGFVLLAIRFVYEKTVVRPLGRYLGVKDTKRKVTSNAVLETLFQKHRSKVPNDEVKKLAKQTDMRELDIQKWISIRKSQNNPTNMFKFCECCWHLLLYTSLFVYGVVILWKKEWMWNSLLFWKNWPQPTDNDIYWYYLIEMGAYWSFVYTLFFDSKKKDFYEMAIHHFATLILTYLSWCASFVRVGCYILVLHDMADGWLALAKIAKYSNFNNFCEYCFVVFTVIWIATRIIIYPYIPLYSVIVELHYYIGSFTIYKIFVTLLVLLQVLHIIWTYFILKVALQKVVTGELQNDARSDSDDCDSSEDEKEMNNHPNSKNTELAQGTAAILRKSKRITEKTSS